MNLKNRIGIFAIELALYNATLTQALTSKIHYLIEKVDKWEKILA